MAKLFQTFFKINIFFHFTSLFFNITAQDFQISGYVKYLFSSSKLYNLDENLIDHTLHSRVNFKWYINYKFNFSAALRNRIVYGESVNKIPDYSNNFNQDFYTYNLSTFLWKRNNSINFLEIDRLWFDFIYENVQLSIGRQRIAWGTSLVWNITDLFNPLSILDFDYEERPASDAIRIQYYTSDISKLDIAFKSSDKNEKSTLAIQYYYNIFEYDFYFLAGFFKQRPVAGFSWAGDIYGAGFRGEILLSSPPDKVKYVNLFHNEKKLQLSSVFSFDYTFINSLYIHIEFLYNNIGKKANIQLYSRDALELGMQSASRLNLFYQIGYNITPLLRGDILSLHNPFDNSSAILLSLNYSVIENLDVSMLFLYLTGKVLSEFSPNSKMFFLRTKYSF